MKPKPAPCLCPRWNFPHRQSDACAERADNEIREQHARELAAERGRAIRVIDMRSSAYE